MNNRQLEAARHVRELATAKRELMHAVNKQIQEAKGRGYETRVAPQLVRLMGIKGYRRRDIQAINRIVRDPDKLSEYVAVFEPATGELISGGEALERYSRYEQSAIYKPAPVEEIPSEAERTLTNFAETAQEAFPDDSVYQRFVNYLDRAIDQDTTIADDSFWKLSHDTIDTYQSGHSKTDRGVQSSKSYWMFKNRDKIQEINSALVRLINLEGERSVVERLRDAGEEIIEDVIVAAIGYNESSSRAVQSILNVLLPSSIKNRAMAMGDVADIADDFEDFEE